MGAVIGYSTGREEDSPQRARRAQRKRNQREKEKREDFRLF
jgi:hypothetical protein